VVVIIENTVNESISVKNNKKIAINVYSTEYDVIKKVAKKVNEFKLVEMEEDHEGGVYKGTGGGRLSTFWDITWHDLAITPDFLAKLEPYQKVNQFPGIYVVCRKNHLARNLMRM
jgi:tubulin polyglutamylase TTLL6/13